MFFFSEFSLSGDQLRGLKEYKYSCTTASFLDNSSFLPAFWDYLQRKTPRWISPNLITLAGFIVNVVGFSNLMCCSSGGLAEPRPASVLLLTVLCNFFYNSCDNVDGKHARALGMGSVVGELFDHGLDSMANIFQLFPAVVALQFVKIDFYLVLVLFLLVDTYSLLFFSRKLAVGGLEFLAVDSTEMQFTSMLAVILTCIFGDSLWGLTLSIPMPHGDGYVNVSVRVVVMVLGSFPLLSNSLIQIHKQLSSPNRANVYYVFTQCAIIWLYSFLIFTSIPGAKEDDCIVYFMMIAACFSKLITETVFQSTGADPTRPWMRAEFVAVVVVFVNHHFSFVHHSTVACVAACFTIALWILYFCTVVHKTAHYLHLPVVTVPQRCLSKQTH